MTKLLFSFSCILLSTVVCAQPTDFEGKLVYRTNVRPRGDLFSVNALQRILFASGSMTVYVKNGNYRRSSGNAEQYYISRDQKIYTVVKGIDTLFYRDYADDTTTVRVAQKGAESKRVAGYDCSSFTLATSRDTTQYFYAPQLYYDPAHTKNLLVGHLNLLGEHAKSLWLESETKAANYVLTNTCYRISREKVDDQLFALPALPVAKFNFASVFKLPQYAGMGSWAAYLQRNMNLELVTKYVKIKKGEAMAEQTARVSFSVLENGEIANIRVLNKDKVHPQLVMEAMRLLQNSKWQPATMVGEKIDFPLVQPIVFRVEND